MAKKSTLAAKERRGYAGKHVTASQLLRRPNIRTALQVEAEKRRVDQIVTAAERDALLSEIIRDAKSTTTEVIQAIKELNKVEGRHAVRIQAELDMNQRLSQESAILSDTELAATGKTARARRRRRWIH